MISLLLDTSSHRLSIGLADGERIVDFIDEPSFQTQSEKLVNGINILLNRNDLFPNDINRIIVAYGPGSYTGVRISVSVAKVWSYAKKVPLYDVSSLAIFKHKTNPTVCVRDARNNRCFVGVYRQKTTILPDQIMDNQAILSLIKENGYSVGGECQTLGLSSCEYDIFANMLELASEEHLVADVLSFKPVYLKGE